MIKRIYKKVNQLRKQVYLNNALYKTKKKYAFVGFGMHSLSNLFPILTHFGIAIKFICTKESVIPESIQSQFPGSVFIHDLGIISNDQDVEAVFVSADPGSHARILMELLKAGKKVFIEKPPCADGKELEQIIQTNAGAVVFVGLQRRFWPGNKYLHKIKEKARSYIYRFYFGSYPQGDPFSELFIHAVDYCIFIFGAFEILSISHQIYNKGITLQIHVKHHNGITGLIELSTHYSWNDPVDAMSIQCVDELLEIRYPVSVEGRLKPGRILNIPSERLLHKPVITKQYFSVSNLIIPSFDLNTLVLQGFFDEIRSFIELVEKGKPSRYVNDLIGLKSVYQVLDELRALAYPTASL